MGDADKNIVVRARALARIFPHGGEDVVALDNIDIDLSLIHI